MLLVSISVQVDWVDNSQSAEPSVEASRSSHRNKCQKSEDNGLLKLTLVRMT